MVTRILFLIAAFSLLTVSDSFARGDAVTGLTGLIVFSLSTLLFCAVSAFQK